MTAKQPAKPKRAYVRKKPYTKPLDDSEVVAALSGRGGAQAFSGEYIAKEDVLVGPGPGTKSGKVGFGFGGTTPNVGDRKGLSARNKPWRDALDRAIAQSDGQKLRKMADALIKRALQGDVPALKEIGDRLDGKAIQQVESKVEATVIISVQDSKL